MPEDVLNPYAPPVDVSPVAEPEGLWTVAGDSLLVRDGARLPAVSLEGDGRDLTPVSRQFAMGAAVGKGQLVGLLPLLLMVAWLGYSRYAGLPHGYLVGVLIAVVGSRLLGRFQAPVEAARIQGFISLAALRERSRRNRIRAWIIRGGLGVIIMTFLGIWLVVPWSPSGEHRGGTDFSILLDWIMPLAGFGLALTLSAALWQAFDRGLRCNSARDGWLEIRGVPAASLAALSRQLHRATPVMRKRRVCTLHQYRLPLMLLAGKHRWNPRVLLVLALLKARRSPRLEQLRFHWSEDRELPVEDADAALLARWRVASGDPRLAGWSVIAAERVDYPAGDIRVEALVAASPERRHFAILSVTRASTGTYFAEIEDASFRTWTADERCLVTGASPMIEPLPERVDFARVKAASLADHLDGHLARMAGVLPVPIPDMDTLRSFDRQLAEACHRAHEAAGIESPFEERELPEVPAD